MYFFCVCAINMYLIWHILTIFFFSSQLYSSPLLLIWSLGDSQAFTIQMLARRRRTNSGGENQANQSNQQQNYRGSTRQQTPTSTPPRSSAIDPDMTCRDRSNEFMSVVKSIQSRQVFFFHFPMATYSIYYPFSLQIFSLIFYMKLSIHVLKTLHQCHSMRM